MHIASSARNAQRDVLFACKLYLGVLAVTLFVDSNVLSLVLLVAAWTVVSEGDVDFLLRESSIFPSDARGGSGKLDFPFYLCDGSFLGRSVTPVRRREDTRWNGDSGVKVQIARSERRLNSLLPFGSRESRLSLGRKRKGVVWVSWKLESQQCTLIKDWEQSSTRMQMFTV